MDMREAFTAWVKTLPASQQANILDAMERDESTTFRAFQAGAQHEREECAKTCDSMATEYWRLYRGRSEPIDKACIFNPHTEGLADGAALCAEEIRSRSKDSDKERSGGC